MPDDIDQIAHLMEDDIDKILSEDEDQAQDVPVVHQPAAADAPLFHPLLEALRGVMEKGATLGAEITEYMQIDDPLFLQTLAKQVFESEIREDIEELNETLSSIESRWNNIVHTIHEYAEVTRPE